MSFPAGPLNDTTHDVRGLTPQDKVAFLMNGPLSADESPPERIETRTSHVFLTQNRAWKLKKPVRLSDVDQSTLAARAHLCREEVRVNQELARDVYRGVWPLVQRPDGGLALGGKGCVVDWLVEMVRLPSAAMLDQQLTTCAGPRLSEIVGVGDLLFRFYDTQHGTVDAGAFYLRSLIRESQTSAAHLRDMRQYLGYPLREDVLEFAGPALESCGAEIMDRARKGYLTEGHGDLRAKHVCLTDPPVVFDRTALCDEARLVDPFAEFNGLGIECACAGAGWVRSILLVQLSLKMPPPSRALLTAYGVVSCLTRARLAIDHMRDTAAPPAAKWSAQAGQYQDAAAALVDSYTTG